MTRSALVAGARAGSLGGMFRCALLAAVSVVWLAAARAELTLQPPTAPVLAGAEFELGLLVTNPGETPLDAPAPNQLPLVVRAGRRATSAVFLPLSSAAAAEPLGPGEFRRLVFRGRLPEDFVGLVLLDASATGADRAAIEVTPRDTPPAVAATAQTGGAAAVEPEAPAFPERRDFGLSPHDPVYFSVGGSGGVNARFQLSFKFRPIGPSDDRVAGRGFWEDLYVGFTQTSIWDLHSLSKPFTDSSYRPAIFYHRHDTGVEWLGAQLGFAGGIEHESNGKAGADSRSINLVFARPTLHWGRSDGWQFTASPKLYWYLDKKENDDIQRFRGYGDFLFAIEHPRSWKLAATFRAGTSGHGSVLLDATYPFAKLNDLFPLGWVHGYLHIQFFDGWGESLLHYDERADTQLRIGFMAIR
ncbi:MAG: phospholipase A [Opitutaceae bacterium]